MVTDDAYPTLPADVKLDNVSFDQRAARGGLPTLANGSVRKLTCIHVLQYLTGPERIAAWNEWHRVLEPGGRVEVVVPHYAHVRAFAHPLSQWPPLSDLSFFFLSKSFREQNSAHPVPGLDCDFEVETYTPHVDAKELERRGIMPNSDPSYDARSQAWLDDATRWYWNVLAELTVWLRKR